MTEPKLVENVDYYFDPDGKFVLTAHYLKKRGHCCQNGCRHCPYGFTAGGTSEPSAKKPKS